MQDRYPITPAEHDSNAVFVHFAGTSIIGRYVFDPQNRCTSLHALTTNSHQLQAERADLRHEVGPGRLVNALVRARDHFVRAHAKA